MFLDSLIRGHMRTFLPALALLAACSTGTGSGAGGGAGGSDVSAPPGADATPTPLSDTRWNLVELSGAPATRRGTERDPWIRFTAADGRATGSTGCNSMGGSYTLDGDRLTFGPMVSTKMACLEGNLMAQESRFLAVLDSVERFTVGADTLALYVPGTAAAALRFTAAR